MALSELPADVFLALAVVVVRMILFLANAFEEDAFFLLLVTSIGAERVDGSNFGPTAASATSDGSYECYQVMRLV